ncbi:MAG: hypothetical protein ACI4XL_12775 [Bacillus sp. (in: firmicutes)]
MLKNKQISLTTDEFAVALVLCGQEALANQILHDEGKLQSEETFNLFVSNVEDSLKFKEFWNGEKESLLIEELEEIIKLLVLSHKKIRFITGNKVTFLHELINGRYLLQIIEHSLHTFSYVEKDYKFLDLVKQTIRIKEPNIKTNDWHPLFFDSETFDEFYNRSLDELHILSSNEAIVPELKYFIEDFIDNNQEFDNVSCMIMDTKKDIMQIVDVLFYLSGRKNIWFVDYEKVKENKIYIVPEAYEVFIGNVNDWFTAFFTEI